MKVKMIFSIDLKVLTNIHKYKLKSMKWQIMNSAEEVEKIVNQPILSKMKTLFNNRCNSICLIVTARMFLYKTLEGLPKIIIV